MKRFPPNVLLAMALADSVPVALADARTDLACKRFDIDADHAGLYVYRNEVLGAGIKMTLRIDGVKIGDTGAMTYLFQPVTPGRHRVTSEAENIDHIDIDFAAGTLVFLWQEVIVGEAFAGAKLHLVDAQEGRRRVTESRLALGA